MRSGYFWGGGGNLKMYPLGIVHRDLAYVEERKAILTELFKGNIYIIIYINNKSAINKIYKLVLIKVCVFSSPDARQAFDSCICVCAVPLPGCIQHFHFV